MGDSYTANGIPAIPASYGYSNFIGQSGGYGGQLSLGQIQEPSSKILVAERVGGTTTTAGCANDNFNNQDQDSVGWHDWDGNGTGSDWSYACELFAGHTKQANFLFCDGHVKALNPVLTSGVNSLPNMWGCGDKSITNTQYPTACTNGDINGDNPDPGMTSEMNSLVASSN